MCVRAPYIRLYVWPREPKSVNQKQKRSLTLGVRVEVCLLRVRCVAGGGGTLFVQVDDGLSQAPDDMAALLLAEAPALLQELLQLAALAQLHHQVHPLKHGTRTQPAARRPPRGPALLFASRVWLLLP